ncbi:MAG: RNA-processing protein [Methanobacteriota archaeon]|nr:MAG: RNA-processing protein [Euryarchaeota archaeon]
MEHLTRIPKDRIAVLIGKRGATRKMIEEACGADLEIDSKTGDVSAIWNVTEVDLIKRMKIPDVINAIGRGLAPKRAIQLIEDEMFLQMYDIRKWVGRQPNQTRRMRSRLIGTNGRIRTLIEELTGTEMAIYGSTIIVIGDQEGLDLAKPAILYGLEQDRKRQRIRSRSLETFEDKGSEEESKFDTLVPGLADARRKRERRFKSAQVDPEDEQEVTELMEFAEDEGVVYEEE